MFFEPKPLPGTGSRNSIFSVSSGFKAEPRCNQPNVRVKVQRASKPSTRTRSRRREGRKCVFFFAKPGSCAATRGSPSAAQLIADRANLRGGIASSSSSKDPGLSSPGTRVQIPSTRPIYAVEDEQQSRHPVKVEIAGPAPVDRAILSWGCSSISRAPALQAGGCRREPGLLHQPEVAKQPRHLAYIQTHGGASPSFRTTFAEWCQSSTTGC